MRSMTTGKSGIGWRAAMVVGLLFAQAAVNETALADEPDIATLQGEIRQAELKMFAMYNKLTTKSDFRVNCGWESPTGSRLRFWVCETGYQRRAKRDDAQDFFTPDWFRGSAEGINAPTNNTDSSKKFAEPSMAEQLNAEMKAQAMLHPELALAMQEINAKMQKVVELQRQQGK